MSPERPVRIAIALTAVLLVGFSCAATCGWLARVTREDAWLVVGTPAVQLTLTAILWRIFLQD